MGHLLVPHHSAHTTSMAHSVSRQQASDLRIPQADTSAAASSDSGQQSFRTAVLEGFNTRMQACYDGVTRDALRQLADEFQQTDVPTPLAGTSGSEKRDVPASKSVDRFISQRIQTRIHQLDSRISQRLQLMMPAHKASTAFQLGIAESRVAPLRAACDRAKDNALLQTCLHEHLSATMTQRKNADRELLAAGIGEVYEAIELQINQLEEAKQQADTKRRDSLLQGLNALIDRNIHDNLAQIQRLSAHKYLPDEKRVNSPEARQVSAAERYNTREEEMTQLVNLAEQLQGQETIEALPAGLSPASGLFLTGQAALVAAREQLAIAEKAAATSPAGEPGTAIALNEATNTSARLLSKESELTSQIGTLRDEAAARSRFSNLMLHIRRAFGGGKGQKTHADFRAEIKLRTADLAKVRDAQKHAALNVKSLEKALSAEVASTQQRERQQALSIATLRTDITGLEKQHKSNKDALMVTVQSRLAHLRQTLTENPQVSIAATNVKGEQGHRNSPDRTAIIRQLEALNAQLTAEKQGNLLDPDVFNRVCEKISPSHQLDALREKQAEYLHAQSPQGEENKALNDLYMLEQKWIKFDSTAFDCEVDFDSNRPFATEYSIHQLNDAKALDALNIGRFSFDPQTQQDLLQAAHLYALQCVDKIRSHPLSGAVKQAAEATPRMLEQLSSLETEVNRITENALNIASETSRARSKEQSEKIGELIQGLRRIATHTHEQALSVAADFNDQRYVAETDGYTDRQNAHGTCTLHCWNNLQAYLSDNQLMQLTPFRTEKLVQSEVVLAADQILGELLEMGGKHDLKLNAVANALEGVIRSSDLVQPSELPHFIQQGCVMEYAVRPDGSTHAEANNLFYDSLRFFEGMGSTGEMISTTADVFSRENRDEKQIMAHAQDIVSQPFDAYALQLIRKEDAHAVALIRTDEDFALVDSNHTEPVRLTLKQLIDFFCTGQTDSEEVNNTFVTRNYDSYTALRFISGFDKGAATQ